MGRSWHTLRHDELCDINLFTDNSLAFDDHASNAPWRNCYVCADGGHMRIHVDKRHQRQQCGRCSCIRTSNCVCSRAVTLCVCVSGVDVPVVLNGVAQPVEIPSACPRYAPHSCACSLHDGIDCGLVALAHRRHHIVVVTLSMVNVALLGGLCVSRNGAGVTSCLLLRIPESTRKRCAQWQRNIPNAQDG